MNLSDIVTSLEMSRKLKEAGFEAETCFKYAELEWGGEPDGTSLVFDCSEHQYIFRKVGPDLEEDEEEDATVETLGCGCCSNHRNVTTLYPAYTFEQLWSVLPLDLNGYHRKSKGNISRITLQNSKVYSLWEQHLHFETLPDLAADAVLWCIKRGYIKI